METMTLTPAERFWAKVDKSGECWIWTASKRYGYGQFRIGGSGSQNLGAHAVAYMWLIGDIPGGMVIDHLCRVRACVNPSHMEVVRPEENSTRGMISRHQELVFCTHGHRWSKNARINADGYRVCEPCLAERRNTLEMQTYHREYQREYMKDEKRRETARLRMREYRRKKKETS